MAMHDNILTCYHYLLQTVVEGSITDQCRVTELIVHDVSLHMCSLVWRCIVFISYGITP